ncbi:hypothetical protein BvCmsOUP020_04952 [Escherichia coli]|nr:hypothetical protein BvCmsOUP020_04952 [Escherichia coli]
MCRAGAAVHHRHILPERMRVRVVHHLRVTPGIVSHTGVHVVNQRQTAGTAQLHFFRVTGTVHHNLFSPPSQLLQAGCQRANKCFL